MAQDPNFQEYPKAKYGPKGEERVVNTEEQEKALKGWTDAPKVTGTAHDDPVQSAEIVEVEEDIEELRKIAESLEIDFDKRTGIAKLKQLIDERRKTQQ